VPAAEPPPPLFPDEEINELFAPVAGETHLAVAASGGSDSSALMHLAHRWARSRPCRKLTVLTVDHGLRTDSAAEARAVGEWARHLGLDQVILGWQGIKPATGLQAAAREARYRLMGEWCREHGVGVLALAHTIDDQAETVLMRLKRGAGVEGLGGMQPLAYRGEIVLFRPLLAVSRQRLRDYLEVIGQRWLDDPSNDNERFERVRMRKALAAAGLEAQAVALTAKRIGRAWDAILRMTRAFLDEAVRHHAEGFGEVELPALLAEPEEIRVRALWMLVTRYGDGRFIELSQAENLLPWVDRDAGQARTLGGCRIVRRRTSLLFGREPGRISLDAVPMPRSGRLNWDNRFDISVEGPNAQIAVVPAHLAGKMERRPDLPAFVQASLPAVLVEGRLAVIPNLGFRTPDAPPDLAVSATFGMKPWSGPQGVFG
jgi:tRNA(Ile)-lysidine synthase